MYHIGDVIKLEVIEADLITADEKGGKCEPGECVIAQAILREFGADWAHVNWLEAEFKIKKQTVCCRHNEAGSNLTKFYDHGYVSLKPDKYLPATIFLVVHGVE